MSTTKWCLVKSSDGERGANGKKKVYEVVVDGNHYTATWGMAEKPERQHQTKSFMTEQYARYAAYNQVRAKLDKGYVLAYSA